MHISDERTTISATYTLSASDVDLTVYEFGGWAHFHSSSSRSARSSATPSSSDPSSRKFDHATTHVSIHETGTLVPSLTLNGPAGTTFVVRWMIDGVHLHTTTLEAPKKRRGGAAEASVSTSLVEVITQDFYDRQRRSRLSAMLCGTCAMEFFTTDLAEHYVNEFDQASGSVRADVYVVGGAEGKGRRRWREAEEVRGPEASEFKNEVNAACVAYRLSDVKVGLLDVGPAEEGLDVLGRVPSGSKHWMSLEFLLRSDGE